MTVRNNPLKGIRHPTSQPPRYFFPAIPTVNDRFDPFTGNRYEVGSFGIIGKDPTRGIPVIDTAEEGYIYYLSRFDTNGDALWVRFRTGTNGGALNDLLDQVGTGVGPDINGDIQVEGLAVDSGTTPSGIPLETVSDTINSKLIIQYQVAKHRTGTPANKNDVGMCSFDDTDFNVDSNGYVTLIGSNFSWVVDATQTIQTEINTGYITTNALTVTATLPATASPGQMVCFEQYGAGEIVVAQNAGQTIHTVTGDTTTGVTGTLSTIDQYSSFCLICVVADTDWMLQRGSHGSLLIA